MRHVVALSDPALGGRAAGSAGERRAARYIARELERVGLHAERQVFAFHAGISSNVYALLEGRRSDEIVVLGAHFDHLGIRDGILYPGAEDNASGVAVVLELARALARDRAELDRSVLFAFFGAEELGMLGSEAFVGDPPVPLDRMGVMVNIDMIGRPLIDQSLFGPMKFLLQMDAHSLGLTGARRRPRLRALLDAACGKEKVELIAPEDLPGPLDKEVERRAQGRGDSVPFERAGVPAVFFGSGESSDYHQPSDTPDRVVPEIMERRARALYQVTVALSHASRDDFAAERDARMLFPSADRRAAGTYLSDSAPVLQSTATRLMALTSASRRASSTSRVIRSSGSEVMATRCTILGMIGRGLVRAPSSGSVPSASMADSYWRCRNRPVALALPYAPS